jgi:hypothetical protein
MMDHLPMTEANWALAAWAFGQMHTGLWALPETVGFEYSGIGLWQAITRTEVLREQVPRLYALCHP